MNIREILSDILGKARTDKQIRWNDPIRFQKEVLPLLPLSIKVISPPPGIQHQFNCFVFALNLQTTVRPSQNGFIYPAFVQELISENEMKKLTRKPESNDIILYRNNNELKHAGKVVDEKLIISKWSGGPILKHPLFHVPVDYGNTIEYYKPISDTKAQELFKKYKNFNFPPLISFQFA